MYTPQLYDKRDSFNFIIVNFPHLSSNIPSKASLLPTLPFPSLSLSFSPSLPLSLYMYNVSLPSLFHAHSLSFPTPFFTLSLSLSPSLPLFHHSFITLSLLLVLISPSLSPIIHLSPLPPSLPPSLSHHPSLSPYSSGRPWPVTLGLGYGLGYAMANCQHDLSRLPSPYLQPVKTTSTPQVRDHTLTHLTFHPTC